MTKRRAPANHVNASDLAGFFGVTRTTVSDWIRAGCPYVEKGSQGKSYIFDTAQVAEWRLDQKASESGSSADDGSEVLKRRKLAAQVDAAEMENARKRGELIAIEDVVNVVAAEYASVRAKLLGIPAALAGALEGCNVAERRKRIEDAIVEALDELGSSGPLTASFGEDANDLSKTPAPINGKQVGRRKAPVKSGGKRRAGSVAN